MKAYYENRKFPTELPVSIRITKNNTFRAHWHKDVEFIYVFEGQIKIGINSDYAILNAGDFAIASSYDIHYYDSRNLNSIIVVLIFAPNFIDLPLGWPNEQRFSKPFYLLGEQKNSEKANQISFDISSLIQDSLREYNEKLEFYDTMLKSNILKLSTLLLRSLPLRAFNLSAEHEKVSGIRSILASLTYMEENFSEVITLEEVSKMAGISKYHYSRLFYLLTGLNFKSFLNMIRIEHAEKTLIKTDAPILEIAFECGFNSIRTFNRAFKEIRGMNPSEYRKFWLKTK